MASGEADGQAQASPQTQASMLTRRLPIGAEPVGQAGTHFRVWAPDARGRRRARGRHRLKPTSHAITWRARPP